MDPLTAMAVINGLVSLAYNIYKTTKQISGEESIPSWGDIIYKNQLLQDQIDLEIAEKKEE